MTTHNDVLSIAFRVISALLIGVPVFKSGILYTCDSTRTEGTRRNHAFAEKDL